MGSATCAEAWSLIALARLYNRTFPRRGEARRVEGGEESEAIRCEARRGRSGSDRMPPLPSGVCDLSAGRGSLTPALASAREGSSV